MTPTEELLSSMLADEAAAITGESLRPLTRPAGEKGRSRTARWGARGFRTLPTVAAAASVLLVIGLVVAARSVFTPAPPFADIGTATSPPPYYVEIDRNNRIIVQSTATGRRTDIKTPPFWVGPSSSRGDAAITASADGQTFVVAYNDWDSLRTNLFRFTLTSSGQVRGFARIRTRRLPGLTELTLAISPDGTQIALAGIPDLNPGVVPSSGPPRLLVVDLRTGHVRTWHGLAGTGATDSIADPAWVSDGSLRFLVATCGGERNGTAIALCTLSGPTGREWTLDIPLGDAPLGSGRVLVRLPGVVVQALSGRGASVTALQLLNSGGIQVARYDVSQGRLLKILYHGKSSALYAGLAADGSGRYVLVNEDTGSFFGWIGDGRFHRLPIHGLYGFNEIVAASW